jgi:hypothetical protein
MASNKREMYAERKGRCEGGEKVGGGYFFVNNQEKTRGNRQNMNYTKLGMEGGGGGEVVEGTQK